MTRVLKIWRVDDVVQWSSACPACKAEFTPQQQTQTHRQMHTDVYHCPIKPSEVLTVDLNYNSQKYFVK